MFPESKCFNGNKTTGQQQLNYKVRVTDLMFCFSSIISNYDYYISVKIVSAKLNLYN